MSSFPTMKSSRSALIKEYPVTRYGLSPRCAADVEIDTDVEFTCQTFCNTALTADPSLSIWSYYFNATFPNTAWVNDSVSHRAEIPLVFGTLNSQTATAAHMQPSQRMQKNGRIS